MISPSAAATGGKSESSVNVSWKGVLADFAIIPPSLPVYQPTAFSISPAEVITCPAVDPETCTLA